MQYVQNSPIGCRYHKFPITPPYNHVVIQMLRVNNEDLDIITFKRLQGDLMLTFFVNLLGSMTHTLLFVAS
jgi:hypothetical protein